MENDERLPTVNEVRKRIDDMKTNRRHGIVYQNALKYLYLTAGRVSEMAGYYSPKGTDATRIGINMTNAVLFLVKTARQKGRRRPVVIPLLYEPWADTLGKWFEVHGDTPPFGGLTMRSFQREAAELFEGLMWPVGEYQKSIYVNIDQLKIIHERQRETGGMEYLIEYPNEERRWVNDPKVPIDTITEEPHWRPFTLESLRQLRIWELKFIYSFSEIQVGVYTGTLGSDGDSIPKGFIERDDHRSIEEFRDEAKIYYNQLLKTREV